MQEEYWDPLRRKNVAATPEEGVRQAFITYLNQSLGYPLSRMMSEYSTTFNGLAYRADIVVFDRQLSPSIIVECKAPDIIITSNVVAQVMRYNLSMGENPIPCLVVTNGTTTCALLYSKSEKCYKFASSIPTFGQ